MAFHRATRTVYPDHTINQGALFFFQTELPMPQLRPPGLAVTRVAGCYRFCSRSWASTNS